MIEVIVDSNTTRKDFVANQVLQMVWDKVYDGKQKPVVGVAHDSLVLLVRPEFVIFGFSGNKRPVDARSGALVKNQQAVICFVKCGIP